MPTTVQPLLVGTHVIICIYLAKLPVEQADAKVGTPRRVLPAWGHRGSSSALSQPSTHGPNPW